MEDDLENDIKEVKNKIWGVIPRPVKHLIIFFFIVGSIILFIKALIPNENSDRPYLSITLTNNHLELYPETKTFALSYNLKNLEGTTAYNIKKGHMIFESNHDTCKPYYEPKNIVDVLQPGEVSAHHKDDIGFLQHDRKYFAQFIITYNNSKKEINGKKHYSLVNYEILPKGNNKLLFLVLQKSKDSSEKPINEKIIIASIKNCQLLKGVD